MANLAVRDPDEYIRNLLGVPNTPLPAVVPPPRAEDDRGFFKKMLDVPEKESTNEEVIQRPPRAYDGRKFLQRHLDIPEPEVSVEQNIARPARAVDHRSQIARMTDFPTDDEHDPLVPPVVTEFISSSFRYVKSIVQNLTECVTPVLFTAVE